MFADESGNFHRRVIGQNADEILLSNGDANYPEYWTPDGKAILFIKGDGRSLFRLPLSESRRPEPLPETSFSRDQFRVSPDGRWIAFNSLESGRWEVYAASFPSFTDKRQVSREGGGQPLWRNDGKELFYLSLQGKLMAVDIRPGATLETSDPTSLFQAPIGVNPVIDQYAVTRDGAAFHFLRSRSSVRAAHYRRGELDSGAERLSTNHASPTVKRTRPPSAILDSETRAIAARLFAAPQLFCSASTSATFSTRAAVSK